MTVEEAQRTDDVHDEDAVEVEVEVEVETIEAQPTPSGQPGVITRCIRRVLAWRFVVLVVLAVGSSAATAGLFWMEYRPDRQVDEASALAAKVAASQAATSLLSYSHDRLDRDFAAAKSHLTGNFLVYYDKFTQQFVAPAAKKAQLNTSATVVRAAVSELRPDSAVVLVFVNQTRMGKENPGPVSTASSVRVGMLKVNGHWLVETFDPI